MCTFSLELPRLNCQNQYKQVLLLVAVVTAEPVDEQQDLATAEQFFGGFGGYGSIGYRRQFGLGGFSPYDQYNCIKINAF